MDLHKVYGVFNDFLQLRDFKATPLPFSGVALPPGCMFLCWEHSPGKAVAILSNNIFLC